MPVLNVPLTELTPDVASTSAPVVTAAKSGFHPSLQEVLEETERNQILHALEEANGVFVAADGAAQRLRVKGSTLQLSKQKLDIRLSRTAVGQRKQNSATAT